MKHLHGLAAVILLVFPASHMAAQPQVPDDPHHMISGWKYYSDASLGLETKLHQFFLEDSIKETVLPTGRTHTATVWTKALNAEAMDKAGPPSKEGVDTSAEKLLLGYVPPFAAIRKLSDDERLTLIIWEDQADEQVVNPEVKALIEIDCQNDVVRTLSIVISRDGKSGFGDRPTQWMPIPPESSAAHLSKLICH